jgi:UDP-N-acetylmuramoyl-L-alanyl-D-glutamate--2,6-diaminopimelate ligase
MKDEPSIDEPSIEEPSIDARVAAVEPAGLRPLGTLIERLVAQDAVRGARLEGRPAAVAELARIEVGRPEQDSRRVGPGSLFVAIVGERYDGHDFLADAASAGAAAAVVEHGSPDTRLAQVVVAASRRTLAEAACWWYGDPSRELGVIGITGTDGKTTTAALAASVLDAAGLRPGLVGTVELRVGGTIEPTTEHATTPQAPELQALLRAMVAAGDAAAIVETTSHGLALDRVRGVAYDLAILTNLSHEHLEVHGTFEAYRAAKLRLFESLAEARPDKPRPGDASWPRVGIVNRDDPAAPWFIAATKAAAATLLTYGTDAAADVRATRVEEDQSRLRVAYDSPSGGGAFDLRLAGRFNVHNALAVAAAADALGVPSEVVSAGLERVTGVAGRMERVEAGQPFGVVVDFAHSPASLATVLDILAPTAAARGGGLVAVFGSAGERDRQKRPLMGRIAGERCRLVVVTDEDPRGEDGQAILEEIAAGAEAAGRRRDHDLLLIADRAEAIRGAFERARPGDIVLLAGKGHERTIEYADGSIPWDERSEARIALGELGFRRR